MSGEILRAGREEAPSETARSRTRAALGLGLGAGTIAAGSLVAAKTAAAASVGSKTGAIGGSALLLKLVGVTVIGSAVAVGAVAYVEPARFFARSSEVVPVESTNAPARANAVDARSKRTNGNSSASPNAAPAVAPSASEAPSAAVVAVQDLPPAPAPVVATAPAVTVVTAHAASSASSAAFDVDDSATLADEVRLLDDARAKLAAGDASGALATLDTYKRTVNDGALGPEASVLRVQALAKLGDTRGAQRLGEAFVKAHPDTAQARRVRSILDQLPPASP